MTLLTPGDDSLHRYFTKTSAVFSTIGLGSFTRDWAETGAVSAVWTEVEGTTILETPTNARWSEVFVSTDGSTAVQNVSLLTEHGIYSEYVDT